MPKHDKRLRTVPLGQRQVSSLEAAFIAVEADRLHVSPLQVGDVSIPGSLPERVEIAGHHVDLLTAAAIAQVAAHLRVTPAQVICDVLEKYAAALRGHPKRARPREEKRRLEGSWVKRGGA